MNKVVVLHLNWLKARSMGYSVATIMESPDPHLCVELYGADAYKKVAEIESPGQLDSAYNLTQTRHDVWTKNPEVMAVVGDGIRDTCNGDVFVLGNNMYAVCKDGFQIMDIPPKPGHRTH